MQRRIGAFSGFLFASVVLAALGIFVVWQTREVVNEAHLVARTQEVLQRLAVVDRWAVERELVEPAHRLPQAPVELELSIRNLHALLADDEKHSKRVETLEAILLPSAAADTSVDRTREAQAVIEQIRVDERAWLDGRGDLSSRSAAPC